MLIINVAKERDFDGALRTYKKKIQKTRQTQLLNERKEYVKPSIRRRMVLLKAKYSSQFR